MVVRESGLKGGDDENRFSAKVRRSREVVMTEALRLMFEGGLAGVSIDEITRRTGVSKTTIYRHWPSRNALVMDACARLAPHPEAPDTGSLEADLMLLARRAAEQLTRARWPAVLPSMIDAAERDDGIAALQAEMQAGFAAPYLEVVARAKKREEISPKAEGSRVAAAVLGPLFYRRWFSREPIDEAFVGSIVEDQVARLK